MKKINKLLFFARWLILALVLIFITYSAYLHQTLGGDKAASIHALCPFGGLESLYSVFSAGSLISKIYTGTMILFFITFVIALLFRRSFCGLICPFGTIQEFFGKIGQLIFKKSFVLPQSIDNFLRYIKYFLLLVTVFYAWATAGLWMAPYDPWSVYAHISQGFEIIWLEAPIGVILLLVTVIGSILYDRFFCKYLCPMGALYALIGKISPFKVVRNEKKCIQCGLCSKVCPVNIDVANVENVTSAECLNCQICVLKCPSEGALENKFGKKSVSPLIAMVLVLTIFFVPIWISKASNKFNVTPTAPKADEIMKVSDLKGYMTIKDGAGFTGMSLEAFYKSLKIPKTVPENTKLKEIYKIVEGYNFDKIKRETE